METAIKVGIIAIGAVIGVIVATKVMLWAGDKNVAVLDNFTSIGS